MSKQNKKVVPIKKAITKDAMGNPTMDASTYDSFTNFVAKLGLGTDNISSYGYYSLGQFISRNRLELEAAYRGSWLVGRVVDCIAEDMTRDGVHFFSEMKPKDLQELQVAIGQYRIWHDLASTIKWARLYGGAIAVMLIDGANYEKPLNIEAIGKDKFKGLVVLDRWMLQPSMSDLVTELGADIGKPRFYEVLSAVNSFPSQKIHYSRVLRFDGVELPYYQKLFENLWGLSVVERMLDRLMAFDSATTGAAQLLYKAYLRVVHIDGLREALANGGREESAVLKQFKLIRQVQNSEGITMLDGKDQFSTHTYSFSGVSDMLIQFGQQISGATGIPLVRLFGQSPTGLNSSGESDLRTYYDNVNKLQENQLRPPLEKLFAVISMSKLGRALPEDFSFDFISLWQMTESEKSQVASQDSSTISSAHEGGLITKHTALKELRQQSRVTGRFTNITDDEIEEAKNEPPPNGAGLLPGQQAPMKEEEGEPAEDPNERLGPENPDVDENETTGDSGKWFKFKDFVKMFKSAFKAGFDEESFEESKHPRENDGKFAPKGAGGGSSKPSVKLTGATKVDKDGKRVTSEGKPLPEHIASLKIPPAWTDVTYSPDPKSELLAKGKDSKGRDQYVYSEEHKGKAAEAKFSRIDELNEKYEEVLKQNMGNLKGPKAEVAQVLHLIMQTGIRPGGDDDTQAKVKAYGATTLEGRHVKQKGKAVYLEFIGKKGVPNSIPIEDSYMARVLLDRAKKVGGDGRLFNVDNVKLLGYSESLDGGGFKTKDFRTLLGTRTAMEQVKKEKPPSNEKEYKKKVKLVAKYVSQKLGNTPSVALKAYIHPVVFQGWRSTIS